MRITPFDIQQKQFPMKFRGFHAEEVSSFLEQIREEIEDLLRENASLKEQIQKADAETGRFSEMQELLGKTLQDAHQMAEEYRLHARREVDQVLETAEEKTKDMVSQAKDKALQINGEIIDLKMIRKQFHEEMQTLLARFDNIIEDGSYQKQFGNDRSEFFQEDSIQPGTDEFISEALLPEEKQIGVIECHGREERGKEPEQD